MTHFTYESKIFHPTFAQRQPALRLKPGDCITVELPDAHGYTSDGTRLAEFSNPLAGPFYVEGSEPGDALSVTLEEIKPSGNLGWSYLYPNASTIESHLFAALPDQRVTLQWELDYKKNLARPARPFETQTALEIPLSPMVGCLGVAPALSQAITSYDSGNFGGNMDCPLLTAGTRIEFPVFAEGALLYIGDCHAAQSHGEITGAGIEVPGTVRFAVEVQKNAEISWPRGETADSVFTIASGRPLDIALQRATTEMMIWLGKYFGLTNEFSALRMSQGVRYVVSNAVNEVATIACVLPKSFLP